jgi:hypothetical protein
MSHIFGWPPGENWETGPLPWSLYDNSTGAVIPSEARNLALSLFNAMRNSSSSANKNGGLLGMTPKTGYRTDSLGERAVRSLRRIGVNKVLCVIVACRPLNT